MKYTVNDFADKFRSLVGDETWSVPDDFIITALNWAFNSLPSVPKLYVAWSHHTSKQLDANGHYRFKVKSPFRDIIKYDFMNFYTSTGGDPCPLRVCYRTPQAFYKKNGLVSQKVAGQPCEYTREREGDSTYIVFDRPSNVPIIVDYLCYGRPKPVSSMEDEIEMPGVIENLILSAMRRVFYQEASDFSFAADIAQYLSNKEIVEAVQELNQSDSNDTWAVLGEAVL